MGIFGPTPPKLDEATRARVAKLIGMLTAPNDGEVLNAARLISSTLKAAGADINDLAAIVKVADGRASESDHSRPSATAQYRPAPAGVKPQAVFLAMAEHCLRGRIHDEKTSAFLNAMIILTSNGRCPSDAQAEWLMDLYARRF